VSFSPPLIQGCTAGPTVRAGGLVVSGFGDFGRTAAVRS
jgi:hypothetical protein